MNRQLQAFQENWGKVDLAYAKSKNLTPYDVLIIASIIEKEVIAPEERPLVAAVIYNRLHDGMNLGIDATTRYGLNVPGTEPLLESQLQSTNPYNTRNPNIKGLPPTPIANPGLASMQAAAHPAKVDYLYFVRKPDNVHHFFTASEREFRELRERPRLRVITGRTRLVALLGHPVSGSLSPQMQNAAFAERGLDWAYVACDMAPESFETAVRGLAAAGFAGANVTTPHKEAAAAVAETELGSVNTLVFEGGRILGHSTDAAVLEGCHGGASGDRRRRRCRLRLSRGLARRTSVFAQSGLAARDRRRGPDRQRDLGARRRARRAPRGTDARRSSVSGDGDRDRGAGVRCVGDQWARGARRAGRRGRSSSGRASRRLSRSMRRAVGLSA